jgi:carbon starvation protein
MVGAVVLAALVPALQIKLAPFTVAGLTVSPVISWSLALFVYCFFASVLPVWLLLQPRDYVNSYLLILGLLMMVVGIGAATLFTEGGAPIVAPAVRTDVAGAPPIMPFLFVTIACGAISGFHCLVSSGTSSKQIACETDAQFIGYGSMLTEGFLAVLVILACCAGLGMGAWTRMGVWMRMPLAPAGGLRMDSIVLQSPELAQSITFLDPTLATPAGNTFVLIQEFGSEPYMQAINPVPCAQHELRPDLGAPHNFKIGDAIALQGGAMTLNSVSDVTLHGPIAWNSRYESWSASGGLARTVGAFVDGAGNFVAATGIPRPVAVALMAVLVASFAATTLDTATRLQRYVVQELAATFHIAPLTGRYGATLFAVLTAAFVAAMPPPGQTWAGGMGQGGLILWPVFGATNQLLAGLAFMVVAFYLARRRMPTWFIAIPAVAMLVIPFVAVVYQVFNATDGWLPGGQYHLVVTAGVILALELWMAAEALKLWPTVRGVMESPLPPLRRGFPVVEVAANPTSGAGRTC